jgi:NADH-quinone oxidoreductase subunit M
MYTNGAAPWLGLEPGTLAKVDTQSAIVAMNGAVMQMFNHGLSSAGMFLLVGALYHKAHTRDLRKLGGLWVIAPIYGGILIFTSMASLGLPGLNGFVGEFLVVRGAWPVFTTATLISMVGLLFTGAYVLKGLQKVLHGKPSEEWVEYDRKHHRLEISLREVIAITPLMVLMLVTGVLPNWILPMINDTVTRLFGG